MNNKRSLSLLESKLKYQKGPLRIPKAMTIKELFQHNEKHQIWDDRKIRELKPLEHLVSMIKRKKIAPELIPLANSVLRLLGNCTEFFMFDGYPSSHYQHIFRVRGKKLRQNNQIINGGFFETIDVLQKYEESNNIISVGFNSNNYYLNFLIELEEGEIIGLIYVDQRFQKDRKQPFKE